MEVSIKNILQNVQSELDATEEFKSLKAGDTKIQTRPNDDMVLTVRAERGKPLLLLIVDKDGNAISETIDVKVASAPGGGGGGGGGDPQPVTCWKCGVDSQGNKHCWVIPCPVIEGPWPPGP